jgi:hypothetical protein
MNGRKWLENRVLKEICWPGRDEMKGGCRNCIIRSEHHKLHYSPNTIRTMQRTTRLAGNVARLEEEECI